MTATHAPPEEATRPVRYRFGHAELDLQAFHLTVAGEVRACPPRVLQLLQLLCGAPGTVFGRDELIAALWPGGQVVSDESLAQVIFKLRQVLSDDGEHVVTVRGVGLRLDADVSVVTPDLAAPAVRRVARRPVAWLAVLALLAIGAAFAVWRSGGESDWATARAWGFAPTQLHLAAAASAPALRQALAADAQGDRPRALLLLAAIHDSDATTPVPALLLALWHAMAGERAEARRWVDAARPRVASANDAALTLQLRLADAFADGRSADIMTSLSAVLDQAPQAWILRAGRAQLLLQRGQGAAALADLRSIPVPDLADRRLEDVLADRASLGDADGARAAFDALREPADSVGRTVVAGRLAYSAGDIGTARAAFARAAELAQSQGRADWSTRGLLLAAALAVEMGDIDAARLQLLDAQARARESRATLTSLDANLMLAQVAALRSDTDERDAAIRGAYEAADRIGDGVWTSLTHLVALRLGAPVQPIAALDDADLAARGIAPLVEMAVARRDGDRDRALARWKAALDAGVMNSVAAEEAALLAQSLGIAVVSGIPRDPPPKSNFRLVSRAILARGAR